MTMRAVFLAGLFFLQGGCSPAPPLEEQAPTEERVPLNEQVRESFEVWLCSVHQDQQAVAPGPCPICQRDMVPRLLVNSYSCPMHPDVDEETPGACPICNMDLVVTTRQLEWYCVDDPSDVSTIPGGICSESGEPMAVRSVPLAHGDHNPRHGGILFMAPDSHYHLEGVLLPEGEFRLYFYDELTQPIDADVFAARIGDQVLEPMEDAGYLRASLDPPETYPVEVALLVRFPSADEEGRFDFLFAENMGGGATHQSSR